MIYRKIPINIFVLILHILILITNNLGFILINIMIERYESQLTQ